MIFLAHQITNFISCIYGCIEKGNLNEQVEEEEESVALDSYAFVNTSPASNPDPRSNSNKSLVSSVTAALKC